MPATASPEQFDNPAVPEAVLEAVVATFPEHFTMVDACEMCMEWFDAADHERAGDRYRATRTLVPPPPLWAPPDGPEVYRRVVAMAIIGALMAAAEVCALHGHTLGEPVRCEHGHEGFYELSPVRLAAGSPDWQVRNAQAGAQALSLAVNTQLDDAVTILLAHIDPDDARTAGVLQVLMTTWIAVNDAARAAGVAS